MHPLGRNTIQHMGMSYQHTRTVHVNYAQNIEHLFGNLVKSPPPVYSCLYPVPNITILAFERRWQTVRRYSEAKLECVTAR